MLLKNGINIKKIRTSALAFYFIFQILFLNGFTIYMSCFQECCHTPKDTPSCCCSGCSSDEISIKSQAARTEVKNNCSCIHAEKQTDNYLAENQFKALNNAIELETITNYEKFTFGNGSLIKEFHTTIQSKSPPIYLSNSVFLI